MSADFLEFLFAGDADLYSGGDGGAPAPTDGSMGTLSLGVNEEESSNFFLCSTAPAMSCGEEALQQPNQPHHTSDEDEEMDDFSVLFGAGTKPHCHSNSVLQNEEEGEDITKQPPSTVAQATEADEETAERFSFLFGDAMRESQHHKTAAAPHSAGKTNSPVPPPETPPIVTTVASHTVSPSSPQMGSHSGEALLPHSNREAATIDTGVHPQPSSNASPSDAEEADKEASSTRSSVGQAAEAMPAPSVAAPAGTIPPSATLLPSISSSAADILAEGMALLGSLSTSTSPTSHASYLPQCSQLLQKAEAGGGDALRSVSEVVAGMTAVLSAMAMVTPDSIQNLLEAMAADESHSSNISTSATPSYHHTPLVRLIPSISKELESLLASD